MEIGLTASVKEKKNAYSVLIDEAQEVIEIDEENQKEINKYEENKDGHLYLNTKNITDVELILILKKIDIINNKEENPDLNLTHLHVKYSNDISNE
jgi:phage terminase large subunit